MLKLLNITKEYKVDEESVLALSNVSIEFRKNEFVSILGPSGCGKTTLLNIVGGLDRYTSGDIQIDGISTKEYDDVDWDTYRNRRVGFVFQSYNLIPHMNILKNVSMSLTLAGVEKEERKRRALEALRKVGLESQAKKKPNQLSGGQMQRVAIARALVNNPEIILADEPTGALDSESGIQVMDLLKEVAHDRLVVMVTHNPSLAEEYSTRIVYLKDGEVVGDTMPYDSQSERTLDAVSDEAHNDEALDAFDGADAAVVDKPDEKPQNPCCARRSAIKAFFNGLKSRFAKWKKADKAAMKLSTAINLSWNNLLAKKGRTLLTSIAGSIGIIGIVLVLSLSNGAAAYVTGLEESALSTYPLTIGQSNADTSAILRMLMEEDEASKDRESNPDSDQIYTARMLGKVMEALPTMMADNDLSMLKEYIDKNFDKSLATVKYNYGVDFNAFIDDPHNDQLDEKRYMKVNPYTEVMGSVLDALPDSIKNMSIGGGTLDQMLSTFTSSGSTMMTSWSEMTDNTELLQSQYELVGSASRWPSKAEEVVVVVDSKNQLLDYQLFMLGLQSQDDVITAITSQKWADITTSLDQLLSLEYKLLCDADYLEVNDESQWKNLDNDKDGILEKTYTAHDHSEQGKEWIDSRSPVTVKVVGVVRLRAGVSSGSIGGVVGYTHALTELMIERAQNNEAVQGLNYLKNKSKNAKSYMSNITMTYTTKANSTVTVTAGESSITKGDSSETLLLQNLGVAELSTPTSIEFYCSSFEAKEKIVSFINQYNADMDQKVSYGDMLAEIMKFVNTMVTTITGVLVGFAAISLIVSTIMIAIIIYTSVLERRKEIGVLRSIGARKRDISRVFIAESAILGGYSGFIGVIISVILCFIASAIIGKVLGIVGLVSVSWWQCVVMFVVSIVLSMLAGFIPSRIAANKDPAIALRSE